MRIGQIVNKYDVSINTLVSYLSESGVELPDPVGLKTKLSPHALTLIERKFGINYHSSNPESKYMTWRNELPLIHRETLESIETRPTGNRIVQLHELLISVVRKIREYAHKHPDIKPDAQTVVTTLLNGVNERIAQVHNQSQDKKKKTKLLYLNNIKSQYNILLTSMEEDRIVLQQEVPWDLIEFNDGGLWIDANSNKRLYIPYSEAKKVYNIFKFAFNDRVPPLKICFHSKKPIEIVKTTDLDEVFKYLTIQEEIKLGKFFNHKELFDFLIHSKTEFNQSFLPKDKTQYLQFLIKKQSADYRYVPMFEKGGKEEDSFLFTIQGNNELYIVWESIRPDTATYIFPVGSHNYEQFLQALYDYVCSDIDYKRRRVHHGVIDGLFGVKGKIINHICFQQWSDELSTIIL